MNTTHNSTSDCNPLGLYSPGERPVPVALLWVAVIHCYCLVVFGTLGNALALWCVATCTKTRRPIKVLLFSVFLPALVTCLVPMPVITEILTAHLTCDPDRISETVIGIATVLLYILGQIELVAIAAIAVVRAVTVWAPHRPKLGIRGAVVVVVVTCIYGILTGLGFMKLTRMGLVADSQTVTFITILIFVIPTLLQLITAAAYILMIIVIQRNKLGLVNSQPQGRVTIMDQATRAMLAVFISNLVFHAPHSIYHLMGTQPYYMSVIFHGIFFTHYLVDSLVYMWFNVRYREKVLSTMGKVMQSLSPSCMAQSLVQIEFAASCDHQPQHNSSG